MAKQRILETNGNSARRDYIVSEFNAGGQRREDISSALGFANSRALYNALVTQGWIEQEKRVPNGDEGHNKEPKPRKARGILPSEIEKWALLSAQADFIREGNEPEDFVPPLEITPEWFLGIRAVREQTPAFVDKALSRIGGLDSEAGRALRQWAGRPLTKEQADQEHRAAQAAQARQAESKQAVIDRAVVANILKSAERASCALRSATFGFIAEQFGEELFDRMVGSEILPG